MGDDNPFTGLGDSEPNPFAGLNDENPFTGLGDPIGLASAPGQSAESSSWWDKIWTTPEFLMKPVRAAADWLTEPTEGRVTIPGMGIPLPPVATAAAKGAIAGAGVAAAETFGSPGNLALMLVTNGASAMAGKALGAGAKASFISEALLGVKSADDAPQLIAALKEAEAAYGKAAFWARVGGAVEGGVGAATAAHGGGTIAEAVKERDLGKLARGIFEVGFGGLGMAQSLGRFLPGGPPGPGRPRKFYEGGGGDAEFIGPKNPFEGLGDAAAPVLAGEAPGRAAPAAEPGAGGGGVHPVAAPAAVAAPEPTVKPAPLAVAAAGTPEPGAGAPPAAAPAPAAPKFSDGFPDIVAPTPYEQPNGLPEHIAPSLKTLATDFIEAPALRLQAEDLARELGTKFETSMEVDTALKSLPPELAPYTKEIRDLAYEVQGGVAFGKLELNALQDGYGKLAAELHAAGVKDGVWWLRESPLPGMDQLIQTHNGKIVAGGSAVEGTTAAIAGGRDMGSPISIRPLFEFMRAHFKPDTTLTATGELTRRRKIRSYVEEQRRNGPSAAVEGQAAAGEHPPVGGEVRPVDAPDQAAEAGLGGGGGEAAGAPGAPPLAAAAPAGHVPAVADRQAGAAPAEGGGSFAGLGDDAGGPPRPPETVGALALDDSGGAGAPPSPDSGAPGGGLPKYAGAINLWRVVETADDDVARVILETYHAHEPVIQAQQRGHIPIREQQEMADSLGLRVADILKTTPGEAKPAEWLRATHQALTDSANLVLDLAGKYNPARPESRAQFKKALAAHVVIQAKISGARSEAGRALGTLAYLSAVEKKGGTAAIEQVMGKHSDANLDLIADLLGKISPEDLRAVNTFARRAIVPTTLDKVYEYWLNSILSGPATQVANALSNTIMVAEKPVEGLAQAAAAHAISAVSGKPREVYYGEPVHQVLSITRGLREGVGAALQSWKTERPVFGVNQLSELEAHQGAISGRTGKIVRAFGTRPLAAGDEFFKAIIYRMELNGRAYSTAAAEGGGRAKVATRMAEILENPPEELLRAAEKEALYRTFNSEPGRAGKAALDIRKAVPGLRWVIPFVRTPMNILGYGIDRIAHPGKVYTLGKAISDYRDGKIDMRKLSAESAIALRAGVTAMGVGALVAQGKLTGSGPTDPGERRTAAMALTGTSDYPAYSVKLGGEWWAYSRLEPLGTTLGMVADFIELNRLQDVDEVPSRVMAAFRKNFGDKTWVSGLTGLFKAYSDEERYGKAWVLRSISSFVPNLIGTAARAADPVRRLPEDIPSALQAKIPGMTAGAPPALDIFGKVETSPITAGERMFSPIMRRPTEGDPVAIKLQELGIDVDVPSKKVSETLLKELEVKQIAREDLFTLRQARGIEMYGRLQGLLQSEGFTSLPLEQQKNFIERTISDSRAIVSRRARGLLLARSPLRLDELTAYPHLGGPPSQ